MDDQPHKDAESLYERWLDAWRRVDGEQMKSLWDPAFAAPVYQAEEHAEPLSSWAQIDEYWSTTPALIDSIPEARDISHVVSEAGELALLHGRIFLAMRINGATKPFDGELRVSMAMHRVDGDLKLVHYHESRQVDLTPYFT